MLPGLKLMGAESECHVVQLSRVWLKIIAVLFEQWWSIRKIWSSAKCRTVTVMLSNTTSDSNLILINFIAKLPIQLGEWILEPFAMLCNLQCIEVKEFVAMNTGAKSWNWWNYREIELVSRQVAKIWFPTTTQLLQPPPPLPPLLQSRPKPSMKEMLFSLETHRRRIVAVINWRMLVNVDRIVEIYSGRALEGRAGVMYHCGHCWENPGTSESWQFAKKGPNRAPLG